MSEWEPGTVAMVRNEHGVWNLAVCAVRARHGIVWSYGVADSWMPLTADARPLVVIDPENREQVRRLLETYGRQFTDWTPELDSNVTRLQAALRELASRKPAEPTGLGAVVEDASGRRYQRLDRERAAWLRSDIPPDAVLDWREYVEIDAVRVLSEGVQP